MKIKKMKLHKKKKKPQKEIENILPLEESKSSQEKINQSGKKEYINYDSNSFLRLNVILLLFIFDYIFN